MNLSEESVDEIALALRNKLIGLINNRLDKKGYCNIELRPEKSGTEYKVFVSGKPLKNADFQPVFDCPMNFVMFFLHDEENHTIQLLNPEKVSIGKDENIRIIPNETFKFRIARLTH